MKNFWRIKIVTVNYMYDIMHKFKHFISRTNLIMIFIWYGLEYIKFKKKWFAFKILIWLFIWDHTKQIKITGLSVNSAMSLIVIWYNYLPDYKHHYWFLSIVFLWKMRYIAMKISNFLLTLINQSQQIFFKLMLP